jgi:hypothetical protein
VLESKSVGEPVISEAQRKAEKQRRRQSWNDFVIPRNVLEKQKGLKENIGAVKMFAGGIESESVRCGCRLALILSQRSGPYWMRTPRFGRK